ncbi:Protein-tyrosine phosphatase [Caenorhabditis elegans]|uniref:Protein-tyrosine phosphatase n=1 Tax=Caenorhabditis elegans TaxID=6239 RepID=Q18415_CAEEL|nr:Protein-tyrosine phosphatase [Caenorhabditis elegans]CCD66584.2 Protein-tyrosine phosphatase [Caenorhabditis elegans]|eukprot:NP_501293.3 Tyrosine-protein phosphatase [Caenorhabditis elegans]
MSQKRRRLPNLKSKEKAEKSQKGTNDERQKMQKKQIVQFVQTTLEKGPIGLRNEFNAMKRFNDFDKMQSFKKAQDHHKNRYKDVGCLDNNRVKLAHPPWPHDYIHANFVSTPANAKRFICAQAPLDNTCADFWYMCLQERVEAIFMLCNLMEKGAKKCSEYYATKEKPELVFHEKDQKITVKYEASGTVKFVKPTKAVVKETVLIIEGPGGQVLKTTHYHWIDWPDRGVPPADLSIIELLIKARPLKGPIAVHCSAGIGRTGSVVMIEYMCEQLLNGNQIEETDKILQKIREQRNNSIQTDHQYLFVHQVMMNFFLEKKLFDEEVKKAHADFTHKYEKCVH